MLHTNISNLEQGAWKLNSEQNRDRNLWDNINLRVGNNWHFHVPLIPCQNIQVATKVSNIVTSKSGYNVKRKIFISRQF